MPATQPSTTATTAPARPYPAQTTSRSHPRKPIPSSSRLPAQPHVRINEVLTADHPLIRAYLARKLKELRQAEEAHRSDPANAAWHAQDLDYMMPWWRHELAGRITDYSQEMKRPQRKKPKKKVVKEVEQPRMGWTNGWPEDEDEEAVAEDLAQRAWEEKMLEMSWGDVLSDIATHHGVRGWDAKELFAVAALSVADKPSQDVHWALWSRNSKQVTAQMIEEVVESTRKNPSRCSKLRFLWVCKSSGIAMVSTYQHHRRPRTPHPSTKRPTRAAVRKETRDTDASRKRVAQDEGADQATKRRKTEGEASVPLRTSQRLRKSAGVPPVETVKEATEVAEEPIEAELEVDVDVEMMEDEPSQAKAPVDVVPPTKKAARRKRAWAPKKRTKRSTAGKTKATPKDTVQEAESPAVSPQTTASIPTPTSILPPFTVGDGDAENAPSPTVVGSPESADIETRVGTPMEPSNKPVETKLAEVVAAKLEGIAVVPAAKVPARTSARIRQRKTGGSGTRA